MATIIWEEFKEFGQEYTILERIEIFNDNSEIPKKIIEEEATKFYTTLARWEGTPNTVLEKFAEGNDVSIHKQLVQNSNSPYEFIKRVFNDDVVDTMVLNAAKNPQLKEDDIRKYIDSLSSDIHSFTSTKLYNVLQNPNCPHDILKQFYNRNRLTYGEFVSRNPNPGPELLEMCLTNDTQYRSDFLKHANFDEETLKLLRKTIHTKNDITKSMLKALSKNDNLKTNDKLRELFVDSIVNRSMNLSKVELNEIFDNSTKYLSHSDFNTLYDVFDRAHLVSAFVTSKEIPNRVLINMLSTGMTLNMVTAINRNIVFTQEDIIKILINDVRNLEAKMKFIFRYENEITPDTLTRLYDHFEDDRLLPKTVHDIFLF